VQTVEVRIVADHATVVVLIALDVLGAASGGPRLHACKGVGRLCTGDCTEAGEAEGDDESSAHFQIFPSLFS
jgi:hypothetical protein